MSLARFAWRQIWRGAVIWSAVIAIILTSGALTYESAYKDPVARAALVRSVGRMPTFQALYGKTYAIDTTGGFLAWRYGDLMTLMVAIWALLAVTRVLRGDEETMRAEVLLAGAVSPRRLLAVELAVVAAGCGLIAATVLVVGSLNGLPMGGAALLGLSIGLGGIVFGAVAAVTSQLFDARRRASGWAGSVLGISYLVRALADGSSRLDRLAWLSPLGWAERIRPFSGADLVPVAVATACTAVLVGAAFVMRDRRDTGLGLITDHPDEGRVRSLHTTFALDRRLSAGALRAWSAGMLLGMFVMGYLAKDVVTFAVDNPTIDTMMQQIYGFSLRSPTGFLGIAFTVVAMLLGVYAGTHLVSTREEEAAGRADHVLVAGTSRTAWLLARLAIAAVAMAALAVMSAIGSWAGVLAAGAHITLWDTLRGSFNVLPAAVLFGGLAVAAFGVRPRTTAYVAFGSVTLAYVIEVLGGLSDAPSWLTDCSPFSHIAPVPAVGVDVAATVVMLGIGLAFTAIGVVAFGRRDIAVD